MLTLITFIAVLGFLIFIHELGHYMAAKHVGVRVETFSIGFPPTIYGKKVGDTEYKVSWIPLGGYVRLFGQNVTDEDPTDPSNYASKSILQRIYILIGGPAMNLLFALFCMPLLYLIGVQSPAYLDEMAKLRKIDQGSIAEKIGLQANDQIFTVNGNEVLNWRAVNQEMGKAITTSNLRLEVERDGALLDFEVPLQELQQQRQMGWKPFIEPRAGGFTSPSPAREAGLQEGDLVLSINGKSVADWSDLIPLIQQSQQPNGSSDAVQFIVEYERSGKVQFVELKPYFEKKAKLWLMGMSMPTQNNNYGIGESVSMGVQRVWQLTKATFMFLGQMLSGQGSLDDLGGPIRIGMVLGDAAKSGITNLIFLMAFISLQLGIFNLLPIPALDGGHILLLGFEKLKGSPLSTIFRERTQMIGFSVLIALMLFVTWNDLIQLFRA